MSVCRISVKGLRELGRGEQGVVYELSDRQRVVKYTKFSDAKAKQQWEREVKYQEVLGRKGLAPRVHESGICNKKGVIVMDRIKGTLQGALGGKGVCVHKATKKVQEAIVDILRRAIGMGYTHMDNHPDNIGILTDGTPILIDFGFTIKRDLTPRERKVALAFSLYQVIEHMAISCLHKGGAIVETIDDMNRELGLDVPAARVPTMVEAKRLLPGWPQLLRGLVAYNTIMHLPIEKRYDHKAYGVIYNLRQGKGCCTSRGRSEGP